MTTPPVRHVVRLLTAQSVVFGVTLALLLVPANALFLDAYGSKWLPATYIAIAVVGTAISSLIARAARRTRLVTVATWSLGGLAILFLASWALLVAGEMWVSAILLVAFPLALQIGFVLLGGQAGRLLDVRQMKERFPRVVSGFAVGFFVGGLLGIPLLALLGSTEQLLLATVAAQAAFLGLVLATERRFPEAREAPRHDEPTISRPPLRTLFVPGLVLGLLAYQVLSAMGSQVVDFLLFDRAAARYTGDELTRFLAAYTAVLNVVDIAFLALVAGPLLRKFGLRLGLAFNPAVVVAVLAAMAAVGVGAGTASLGLFVLAGVLRIADIAATDGTTRTSINAAYQVVPAQDRLAVQAVVEGVGVPLAIGATGVILLLFQLLDLGTGWVLALGLLLGAVWLLVAVVVYRSYTRSLAEVVRRRPLLSADGALLDGGTARMTSLLRSDDVRDVRLGLDLLSGLASPVASAELRALVAHPDPGVRLHALGRLAASGDDTATTRLAVEVDTLGTSDSSADRRAAAEALSVVPVTPGRERLLVLLLGDPDPSVRAAALDAVGETTPPTADVVRLTIDALADPRVSPRASVALRRLGTAAAAAIALELGRADRSRSPQLVRTAAAVAASAGSDVVAPALDDPDRAVVAIALEELERAGARQVVRAETLERILRDAVAHASRVEAARSVLEPGGEPLSRALADELALARRLVVAILALRHGSGVRDAAREIEHGEGQRRALGIEALDVLLTREEAAQVLPLVAGDAALRDGVLASGQRSRAELLAELGADPDGVWRSPWLARCARHAAESSAA